ncbi:hypothetical protein ACFQZT_20650 [Paenibacillus sp. GCM10027628]|uniref:hypothetical protein n=1 Tax=Paenibacillus sp. GCM10027628 TaxID=3273413 RepID=UPI0036343455
MFSKVNFHKRVTEKWLNRAFAPLSAYLEREHPEEARSMMSYMTFLCNEDQRFYYRNCMTKDSIVFDQMGQLVYCGKEALRYEFGHLEEIKVERPLREERFVHPNVTRWIKRKLTNKEEVKYGEEVYIFLQELWGSMVNYDFEDLKIGHPLRGARLRYCLYLYPTQFPKKIAIQFVGDEIVEKRCSYAEYREYEKQERELVYEGWNVITIIRELLDRDLDIFRRYISKAIELADPRDVLLK